MSTARDPRRERTTVRPHLNIVAAESSDEPRRVFERLQRRIWRFDVLKQHARDIGLQQRVAASACGRGNLGAHARCHALDVRRRENAHELDAAADAACTARWCQSRAVLHALSAARG